MESNGGSHGRVERLDLARQGDRDPFGVQTQDSLRETRAFRSDSKNNPPAGLHIAERTTASRSQRQPERLLLDEVIGEIRCPDIDRYIHSQQAAGGGAQRSWMVRVNRSGPQYDCVDGEGLGRSHQGSQVAWIL